MAFDRAWLRNAIAGYIHDSGGDPDLWIDIGFMKTSQMLESPQNQTTVEATLTTGVYPLPDDAINIRLVEYGDNTLRSVPSHRFKMYHIATTPQVYMLRALDVHIRGFVEGSYQFTYYHRLVLGPQDVDTNDALEAYPQLFLAAALVEAYDWKQDDVLLGRWEQKWRDLGTGINADSAKLQAGDTPAMRAI